MVDRYLFHGHVEEVGQSGDHVSSWVLDDLAVVVALLEVEVKEVPLVLGVSEL